MWSCVQVDLPHFAFSPCSSNFAPIAAASDNQRHQRVASAANPSIGLTLQQHRLHRRRLVSRMRQTRCLSSMHCAGLSLPAPPSCRGHHSCGHRDNPSGSCNMMTGRFHPPTRRTMGKRAAAHLLLRYTPASYKQLRPLQRPQPRDVVITFKAQERGYAKWGNDGAAPDSSSPWSR